MTRLDDHTRWVDWERYSSRQDSRMMLGGLVGEIVYQGDLTAFLPLILLGSIIHVGKACTFGMGKYIPRELTGSGDTH